MPQFKVTVWKYPPVYASAEIEAENIEEAKAKGLEHNWDDEPFEDAADGDYGPVQYLRVEPIGDDGLPLDTDEAIEEDLTPKKTATTVTVWSVTMETEHGGIDTMLFATHAEARNYIRDWCEEWWDREVGGPKPVDPDRMVEEYFDHVEHESYNIEAHDMVIDHGVISKITKVG